MHRHAPLHRMPLSPIRRTPLAHALALALTLAAGPASAGTTSAFTLPAQAYSGSQQREYKVYVPDGLTGPAPLLMALHGCRQTHDDVLRDWGLVAAAERYKFVLVAPFITRYDGLRDRNCWGFWLDAHRHRGRGEPEDLHRIARAVEARFAIDPRRRYVAGLSSGGAMAVVLSVTHSGYFAAVASASGLPYGEDAAAVSLSGCPGSARFHDLARVRSEMRAERGDGAAIPLLVLQNDRDCTVVQPAGRNLRDAQLLLDGDAAHDTPAEALAAQRDCTPVFGASLGCRQLVYTSDGRPTSRSRVETVFYDGPIATPDPGDTDHGHYWIGGAEGRDGRWSLRRGPSYPDIVWDFFARHPAVASTVPPPPPPPPPPAPAACHAARGTPGVHIANGRAVTGGFLYQRALSTGDHSDLGFAWDFYWQGTTLYEGEAGRWFAQPPPGCG